MKKKINIHADHIGPQIQIDLDEIAMVEEYGQRTSKKSWVEALITLKSGVERRIKLSHNEFDDLIIGWLDLQDAEADPRNRSTNETS